MPLKKRKSIKVTSDNIEEVIRRYHNKEIIETSTQNFNRTGHIQAKANAGNARQK